MEISDKDPGPPPKRPSCFGDEVKFINYIEDTEKADCECSRCPSESDCGEFILLKCSREVAF
jgi:hypothetical protein